MIKGFINLLCPLYNILDVLAGVELYISINMFDSNIFTIVTF